MFLFEKQGKIKLKQVRHFVWSCEGKRHRHDSVQFVINHKEIMNLADVSDYLFKRFK